jgi:hypothetical protein
MNRLAPFRIILFNVPRQGIYPPNEKASGFTLYALRFFVVLQPVSRRLS